MKKRDGYGTSKGDEGTGRRNGRIWGEEGINGDEEMGRIRDKEIG